MPTQIHFESSPLEGIPSDILPGTPITFVGESSSGRDKRLTFYVSYIHTPEVPPAGALLRLTTNKDGSGYTHYLRGDRIRKAGGVGSRPNLFTLGNFTAVYIEDPSTLSGDTMSHSPVYQVLAQALDALRRCEDKAKRNPADANAVEWCGNWRDTIKSIMDTAPSGAGIDSGTKFDEDASTAEKLVFAVGFHHMNENGYYDGWTEHTIIVRPSFSGPRISISGRDRNEIKEYLAEVYDSWLNESYDTEAHRIVRDVPRHDAPELSGSSVPPLKVIAVYDNGGTTADRYTVYFNRSSRPGFNDAIGMSEHPFSPQGFGQHTSGQLGAHNGKRITVSALPPDCQQFVAKELAPELSMGSQQQRVGSHATSVHKDADGFMAVVYQNTAVVRFNDHEVILNSNGWRTATTKTRMNQASNQYGLGFYVYQQEGQWFVRTPAGEVPFRDGMKFLRPKG